MARFLSTTDIQTRGACLRAIEPRCEHGARTLVRILGEKVVYMSGYTSDTVLRQAVLESGVPFVQKPFTPDMLVRKVRGALDDGSGK